MMTTRAAFLAAAVTVAAVAAMLVAVFYVAAQLIGSGRPRFPGAGGPGRPERLKTTLTFEPSGGGCDKTEYPNGLRARPDNHENKEPIIIWQIHNKCEGTITVCVDRFRYEVGGGTRKFLTEDVPHCTTVGKGTHNFLGTVNGNDDDEVEDGVYFYEIDLQLGGGEKRTVDPVIDIIR